VIKIASEDDASDSLNTSASASSFVETGSNSCRIMNKESHINCIGSFMPLDIPEP
jgi:hypothetical protein